MTKWSRCTARRSRRRSFSPSDRDSKARYWFCNTVSPPTGEALERQGSRSQAVGPMHVASECQISSLQLGGPRNVHDLKDLVAARILRAIGGRPKVTPTMGKLQQRVAAVIFFGPGARSHIAPEPPVGGRQSPRRLRLGRSQPRYKVPVAQSSARHPGLSRSRSLRPFASSIAFHRCRTST